VHNQQIYKKLIIKNITEEIPGFKTFVFELDHQIIYKSGQYLTLVHFVNHEEIRRSYSITSSPILNEPLSIGVKRIENGFFSRELVDKAKIGDEIITTGAGGFFILPNDLSPCKLIVFFAAGSGITPIYSLIKTILHSNEEIQVLLIYSNASPSKTIFYNALHGLQQQYSSRFTVRYLFSNIPELRYARLHRELMEEILETSGFDFREHSLFYICGPESYMRLCIYVLQENNVPTDHIKREDFVIQKIVRPVSKPPDNEDHNVVVHLGDETYQIPVHYPETILQASKRMGILLPYSCEAGRCGNCVAKCIEGKIWLSYNEVLTETDLKSGLTLTCVGHPYGGDAILEI
jgi:Flavodoxin reductases (ferredoxin-NADPH reductases) family 1